MKKWSNFLYFYLGLIILIIYVACFHSIHASLFAVSFAHSRYSSNTRGGYEKKLKSSLISNVKTVSYCRLRMISFSFYFCIIFFICADFAHAIQKNLFENVRHKFEQQWYRCFTNSGNIFLTFVNNLVRYFVKFIAITIICYCSINNEKLSKIIHLHSTYLNSKDDFYRTKKMFPNILKMFGPI